MKQLFLLLFAGILTHTAYAQKSTLPHFRFVVNGGYSYRLGKISSQITGDALTYMRKLKSGFNIGADAMYYFNETLGAGIKYNRFQSSQSGVIPIEYNGSRIRTNVMDNIAINFIAPSFVVRIFDAKDRNSLHMNMALGYLGFRDNGWVNHGKVILTGGTVGVGLDFGYDIRINRMLSAGAQLSLINGKLTSYMQEDESGRRKITLQDDETENLGHLNISLGLRLNI
ncbi:hypothetical protein [Chitinophaga solisilvae]|uniref:Outer membrane protein beta-barrel domain-containing protein n=1 Tax=Chitinophaga solisilvae TaxID=1233460 RepID=A0A9Q5D4I2_9BACT|nr:hypothetical protein [Chitinophaga solisilvae]NSL86110.1 hypothetical protein [Chitinophaga solisilvae]